MIKLNISLTESEKEMLLSCTGGDYELLSLVEGDSYVLCDNGEYCYNECFEPTDKEFFSKQRYEKVIPNKIIKFYQFYLMNTKEDAEIWYRGRRDANGNWEYDSYSDSLEEAFDTL